MPRVRVFFGRQNEIAIITAALTPPTATAAALEGFGGIGKSALAAQLVDLLRASPAFPGGAIWIPCDEQRGPAGLHEILGRVAFRLGWDDIATEADPARRRAALARALTTRPRTLLALDNVEPELSARDLVAALAQPGHTALLLTARQQLDAPLEAEVPLEPLLEADGENLFANNLRAVAPDRPNAADTALIPPVVADLQRVPLALTLTAAYAGHQGRDLAKVREEIHNDGLQAVMLNDPQRGLRARFTHSFATLTGDEQRTFAALSQAEGTTLPRALALALARAAGAPDPERAVAAIVTLRLADALAGERLRLHPFLRDFAAEQWAALSPPAMRDTLGDAMLAYWQEFAQANWQKVFVLEDEVAGLMGAIAWAADPAHPRPTVVIELMRYLGNAWFIRGRQADRAAMYAAARAAAQASSDRPAMQLVEHGLAVLAADQGRPEEARAGYERALKLAEELGDRSAQRAEIHGLAVLAGNQGRPEEARAGYERALKLAEELGDRSAQRAEIHGLAVQAGKQGRPEEARAGYERALKLAEELGDRSAQRAEIHELAVQAGKQGRPEEARAGYERALKLAEELGDRSAQRAEIDGLAVLAAESGAARGGAGGIRAGVEAGRGVGRPLRPARRDPRAGGAGGGSGAARGGAGGIRAGVEAGRGVGRPLRPARRDPRAGGAGGETGAARGGAGGIRAGVEAGRGVGRPLRPGQ